MNPTLKQLIHFVEHTEFSNEPIRLDQCTIVENQRTFAESHINALLSNKGNKLFLPYHARLVSFYNLITHK